MNRQVPNKKYTIIGDGKVACHFGHYFNLVGISFNQWHRKLTIKQLQHAVAKSDVVLLLISDDAIEDFILQHSFLHNKILIHFSGTLILDKAFGCHPLMTFANELYDLETYQSIPFVCDENTDFDALFPQLKNTSYTLTREHKAYYHAMCVIAGNFTQTLMRKTAHQLHDKLGLPVDISFPYLLQTTQNFINNPEGSATGPIERSDFTTVKKHLQVLQGNELEGVYKSFVELNSLRVVNFSQPKHGLKSTTQLLRKVQ